MNRVCIIGRLANDVELRTTATGKNVASFTVAVQDKSNKDTPFWFRCSAWNQQADFLSNYATKGRLVAVDGRLQSRKFQDSAGNNREVVEIVAESVQLLDRPREDNGTTPTPTANPDDFDPFSE